MCHKEQRVSSVRVKFTPFGHPLALPRLRCAAARHGFPGFRFLSKQRIYIYIRSNSTRRLTSMVSQAWRAIPGTGQRKNNHQDNEK